MAVIEAKKAGIAQRDKARAQLRMQLLSAALVNEDNCAKKDLPVLGILSDGYVYDLFWIYPTKLKGAKQPNKQTVGLWFDETLEPIDKINRTHNRRM
jgi:hypothetical protein